MPEIIVKLGDRVVQKFLLYKDQKLTIGRAPDNDIAIENPAVSRRHTSIEQLSGRYILEDHNSANGTYVNGVRVTKTEILDKDVITVGKHKLHFYNQDAVPQSVAAPIMEEGTVNADQGGLPGGILRISQGKQKDQIFPLSKVETQIGRAADNDIRLHDWFVSKHHAVIGRKGMVYVIKDLDSWRHTTVNGEVVQEAILKPGDEIQFGPKISMTFEISAGSAVPEGTGRRPVELSRSLSHEEDGAAGGSPEVHAASESPTPASTGGSGVSAEESHDDTPPPLPEAADPESNASPTGLTEAQQAEVAMWEKALANPSAVIRRQAARKLKAITGRDYDVQ